MSAEDEDLLDFGEEEEEEEQQDDRGSEISLGFTATTSAAQDSKAGGIRDDETSHSKAELAQRAAQQTEPAEQRDPDLPKGWALRKSRQGEVYYLNTLTNKSTWDRPTEPAEGGEERARHDDRTTNSKRENDAAAPGSKTAVPHPQNAASAQGNEAARSRSTEGATAASSSFSRTTTDRPANRNLHHLKGEREEGETDSEKGTLVERIALGRGCLPRSSMPPVPVVTGVR